MQGPEEQQELSVLTPVGLCSFILSCDYPLGYCLAFIVCVNTLVIFVGIRYARQNVC